MLSNTYLLAKTKVLLNIEDTTLYDDRLEILIGAAMSKIAKEGVPNRFSEGSGEGFEYCCCVAYQVALDMEMEANTNLLLQQYLTRVNELRCYLRLQQS